MKPPVGPVDIFLCHTGVDKPWVETLAKRIERETWNGRNLKVFLDIWDIQPGENILTRIDEGLKNTRFLGVILSPEMVNADWPTLEWNSKVFEDPAGKKGKIIPILLRDRDLNGGARLEIPLPLRILNWLDFRNEASFNKECARLIRRIKNEPPLRGIPNPGRPLSEAHPAVAARLVAGLPSGPDQPDPVQEVLISNLLPVIDYPKTIWSASTEFSNASEVRQAIRVKSPFRLNNKRLYCFEDLTKPSNSFHDIIKTDIFAEPVGPWRLNPDKWRLFIAMMNQAVRDWCLQRRFLFDQETGRIFFMPSSDGKDRIVSWRRGKKPRTVVKCKRKATNEINFFVHHGAIIRFQTLGDRLFLSLSPCWVFTTDGRTPIRGKTTGPLTMRWGGKERNGQILRNILFWATVLSLGHDEISIDVGDAKIRIRTVPATANIGVGVDGDRQTVGALLDQTGDDLTIAVNVLDSIETASLTDKGTVDPQTEPAGDLTDA